MIKVVIVTNIPSPYRVDIFNYMQINIENVEFYVIYTNKNEDNRQWKIDNNKLRNTIILESKIIKIRGQMDNRYIHIPPNIWSELTKIMPDIIIAFEYNLAAIQCLLWAKKYKKKIINLTDGTLYSERNIGTLQCITRRIICKSANGFIASSTKAKEKLISWGVPKEKITLAYLTVNLEAYNKIGRSPERNCILYVGSLVKRKGIDLLIEALGNVQNEFELHIVGNGTEDEVKNLLILANKYGIEKSIILCGFKSGKELLEEYRRAKIFVLPSREDCFGLVLLEAAACGIPIVSSMYADGAYDIVLNGINGRIVDPFDCNKFSKAIDEVINCDIMQDKAKTIDLTKFCFASVADGYLKAILKCI